jgi:nucleoid-associated protein YgaU
MNIKRIILLLSLCSLVSCGLFKGSKSKKKDQGSVAGKNRTNEDEDLLALSDNLSGSEEIDDSDSLSDKNPSVSNKGVSSKPANDMQNELKTYKVEKSETLMMVSFKLYGDYRRWKRLAVLNKKLVKGNVISEGAELNYYPLATPFVWEPKGSPYLIKLNDNLGMISKSIYKDQKYWKVLWDNNKPMIKDPNLIFAGFTLYYPTE